jgi:serine/threonine protein kinase
MTEASVPRHALIGVIGPYNLLEALPASGPGHLYRARDTKHGRTVGVRVLPADFAPTPAERASFLESARGLVRMSHPNVTTLFDIGEHEGRVFVVFEFLVGQPLRAEMVGQQVRVRRALELAIQMADAVGTAHALGFSHGGLSPESIVVTTRGHAKIPAFELAVREGFEPDNNGRLRDYPSPEEARGEPPDDRSDVYSVGAILYEMLTTKEPHPRGSAAPSASNTHVSPELDQAVLKAVAPNPDSRYESAAALAAALRKCLSALDATGGSADDEEVAQVEGSRATGKFALAAAVGIALAAALFWWFTRS